jgi:nitroreductase
MDVKEAIEKRRAYRALAPVEITDETVEELAEAARLAASCFNNQPWRLVFVRDPAQLEKMRAAMSQGNEWAFRASMIVAVFCRKADDCVIREREYYLFDTGMAVGQMLLRATELGLVAHPIAGFSPKKAREVLGIPEEYTLITLVIVGKHGSDNSLMKPDQIEAEKERPERSAQGEFAFRERFAV